MAVGLTYECLIFDSELLICIYLHNALVCAVLYVISSRYLTSRHMQADGTFLFVNFYSFALKFCKNCERGSITS